MEREENCREMAEIMRQISPECQRYLVELARAAQKVESCLPAEPCREKTGEPV